MAIAEPAAKGLDVRSHGELDGDDVELLSTFRRYIQQIQRFALPIYMKNP